MAFEKVSIQPLAPRDSLATVNAKVRLLAAIEETGLVSEALLASRVSAATAATWRREDKQFAESWDKSVQEGSVYLLEAEGMKRALAGSDQLLMFFLRAANRSRYDDAVARTKVEQKGIQITLVDAKKI